MKLFVPGRICLFGEHSDWAGGYRRINADIEMGYTLITGTDQGVYAEVQPHPTSLVLSSTRPDGTRIGPTEIPMQPQALLETAQAGGFWSYIAGVAYQVQIFEPFWYNSTWPTNFFISSSFWPTRGLLRPGRSKPGPRPVSR